MSPPIAAEPGFSVGDPYAIGLLFLGVALCAAIGALSHQHERAFSASVIYLGLGVAAGLGLHLLGGRRIDPIGDAELVGRIAELSLLVAVFTAGLKVERRLGLREWRSVAILIVLVMPATIGLVALFATQAMGLSLGAALILGAVLAPTDPVLAGDVGIGPPGEQPHEPEEPQFAVSAEAGLNDGLATPFVLFAILVAAGATTGSFLEWALADVLYAVPAAGVVGALGGYGLAALVVPLRQAELFDHRFDGFVSIAAPLLLYGLAEALGAYGLVAGFVGGIAFRRYEFDHDYNRRVHDGAEVVEKLFELAVILLLGSMITVTALDEPGLAGWLLVPVLLLVIRPATVFAFFVGQPDMSRRGRTFVAWFGVRGVAAVYFVALAVQADVLSANEQSTVVWTALACVAVSIVVHGITGAPLTRRVGGESTGETLPRRPRSASAPQPTRP